MTATNEFFVWFYYGLSGLGGWFIFLLMAATAVIWVFYDSSKRHLSVPSWRIGIVLTAFIIFPSILYRLTTDPLNPFLAPFASFAEPIFYLGVLSGILSMILAFGYSINRKVFEIGSRVSDLEMGEKRFRVSKKPVNVFLCHAKEDKPAVRELYRRLLRRGFNAWLDEENLLPGQDWRQEIPKAVRNSDVVVICLSKKSIDKSGFVQKEIRYALDIADEKPEGRIFLIPARLEECNVPERLSEKQWVDLFTERGFDRLVTALEVSITK